MHHMLQSTFTNIAVLGSPKKKRKSLHEVDSVNPHVRILLGENANILCIFY